MLKSPMAIFVFWFWKFKSFVNLNVVFGGLFIEDIVILHWCTVIISILSSSIICTNLTFNLSLLKIALPYLSCMVRLLSSFQLQMGYGRILFGGFPVGTTRQHCSPSLHVKLFSPSLMLAPQY